MRNAIGRSSCRTGVKLVRLLCERRRVTDVTIVADRDKSTPEAPEGVGMFGAQELAAELGSVRLPPVGGWRRENQLGTDSWWWFAPGCPCATALFRLLADWRQQIGCGIIAKISMEGKLD